MLYEVITFNGDLAAFTRFAAINNHFGTNPVDGSYCSTGRGVSSPLGGKRGYSTLGWLPVSVRRKATNSPLSLSLSCIPSWADPMIATASARPQTFPEWNRITSYNVCYTKLLRYCLPMKRPLLLNWRITPVGLVDPDCHRETVS